MNHGLHSGDQRLELSVTANAIGPSLRRNFDVIASSAIPQVQIDARDEATAPQTLSQSARRDLLAVLRRHELSLSGVDCYLPLHVFAEAAHVDRAVGLLLEAMQLAADLGRVPVSCILPAVDADDHAPQVHDAIEQSAQRLGVPVANHAPRASADPNLAVGIGVDPVVLTAAGVDPAAHVALAGEQLVSARLGDLSEDGMRVAPPTGGRVDLLQYAASLDIAGYEAAVIIDTRQWQQPIEGMHRAVDAWRQVVQMGSR